MKFGKYFTPSRVFGCACKIWLTWKWVPLTVKYSPFTRKTIYRPILPSKLIFWSLTPEKRERARGKVTNSEHPPPTSVRSRCPILLHASLTSHAKSMPKHGEIDRQWSPDRYSLFLLIDLEFSNIFIYFVRYTIYSLYHL